ncbi:MAG TPA: carboxypeptidase regulatory-like domain-containing protein [Planctomycetota bacterium]|nr:carboxypeptidase regulatory-like domain-containing protein [Planctomycetota bacterium]
MLILLLALLGAGILGAGWWLVQEAPAGGEAAALPEAEPAAGATESRAESERPSRLGRLEEDRASVSAAERTEDFDLPDAIWLEGRVVLPPGTPADERAMMVGIGYPEPGLDLEALKGRGKDVAGLDGTGELDDGASRARRALEPDGSFRLPFAKATRRAVVAITARYLYLEAPLVVEMPQDPVTLEPRLGGWLTGRLALPSSALDAGALEGTAVQVFGYSLGGGGMHRTSVKVGSDLAFEAGGLRPELSYGLMMQPEGYVAEPILGIDFQGGAHLERTIELRLGSTVGGRVVDDSGAPVPGVSVRFEAWRMLGFGGEGRAAETDASGAFTLRAVRPGKATILASADGWAETRSEALELADGQHVADLRLVLGRGNSVMGRVLWPEGKPAISAKVVVVETLADGTGARQSWLRQEERTGETDARGAFRISGLGAGPFTLRASALRGQPNAEAHDGHEAPVATWFARRGDVPAGADVELRLEAPGSIRGRALDDTGAPVTALRAQLMRGPSEGNAGGAEHREVASEDGSFEIGGLEPGTWYVRLEADGHGPSEEKQARVPGEPLLEFTLPRCATVRGRATDAYGSPIAAAEVSSAYGGTGEERPPPQRQHKAVTDEHGAFELEDLPPGSLTLRASADGFGPGAAEPLELAPGEVREGVRVVLGRGGTLTGEIYTQAGLPDVGRKIQVGTMRRAGGRRSAVSDAAGRFQVEHLAPGSYQVMAVPDIAQLSRGGEPDPAQIVAQLKMTTAEIREGETTHVVLGAPPKAPVRLHGRVTAGGEPLSGGFVMAFADGTSMLSSMKMARTDERGAYELRLDSPGAYTLIASRVMGGDDGSEFHETIPEQPEHRLDLALPLGSLAGTVRGSDGAPLALARVALEREDAFSVLSLGGRSIRTDGDGRYEFAGLAPGTYAVRATPPAEGRTLAVAVRGGVVVAADRATSGIDLRLARAGTISGKVLDAERRPAEGASVYVRDAQGRIVQSAIQADAGGRFRFDGAGPGGYTLLARKGDLASRESAAVDVDEGETSEVELVLEPGTLLRVSVEDGEGASVRAALSVTDERGRELARLMGRDTLEAMMSEGFSSTEQRVGPLPAGRYTVRATASDGRSATRPVTLAGQGERRVKLRLE